MRAVWENESDFSTRDERAHVRMEDAEGREIISELQDWK